MENKKYADSASRETDAVSSSSDSRRRLPHQLRDDVSTDHEMPDLVQAPAADAHAGKIKLLDNHLVTSIRKLFEGTLQLGV